MVQTETQLVIAKNEYNAFLLGCLAGIPVITYLLVWAQFPPVATVGALVLLIAGVIYFVAKVKQDHLEYSIDDQGIWFGPGLGGHLLPWTDIVAITDERQLDGPNYVQLRLRADAPYWVAISPLRKQLLRFHTWGEEPIPAARLHTAGLEAGHQEILVMLLGYFQKYQDKVK